jgi:PIN domain nuclease of toxin-antitoxin system
VRLLLDTATLLWLSDDASRVSPAARAAYVDPTNDVYVSVISLWEAAVKHRLGKLHLSVPVEQLVASLKRTGDIDVLPLTESAVLRLGSLPDLHHDPFDRMLLCQALDERLTFVTPDRLLSRYPVPTLW